MMMHCVHCCIWSEIKLKISKYIFKLLSRRGRFPCSSFTFINISWLLLPWKQANPHATSETVAGIDPVPRVLTYIHTYIDVALRHRYRPGASQATSITCNFPAFAAINFTGAQQQQQEQQQRRRRGIRATPSTHTHIETNSNPNPNAKPKPTRGDTTLPYTHTPLPHSHM